eukprot:TRINITY_DN3331_c0_g1_i3.p1 TRINITY_DN3331_c0_g1~~TRINITY_DN3331_c0_g1_i3.p1  ORF type:complete len:496 (-),score=78.96 TRINITY_DN3331_c0_g1_i3:109-1596(-)
MGASGSTGGGPVAGPYLQGGTVGGTYVQGGIVGGTYVHGGTVNSQYRQVQGGGYYVQGGGVPANAGYYAQAPRQAGGTRMVAAPVSPAASAGNGGTATLDCTSVCFEPTGGVASEDWQYMGPTKGSYEKVETYQYVGPGAGSVDKVGTVTYTGWRCRWICMAFGAVLMVLIIALLVWLLLRGKPVQERDVFVTATSVPFDCDAGFWNWQKGWSYAKKDYCCRTSGKACHEEPKATGECVLWGDPHIKTFDKSRSVFYSEGDFWIVKSPQISIQGRFQATDWTRKNDKTDYSSMTSIVIGGSFNDNHKIEVQSMLGKILCDGADVLSQFGVRYCGQGKIVYDSQGALVDQAMAFLQHRVVHMDLPLSLQLQVNRWPNFINAKITMTKQDGQDGVCGNFNGNSDDDMGKELHKRFGQGVPAGELLFPHPIPMVVPQQMPSEKRCGGEMRKRAEEICKNEDLHSGWSYAECLGDICDAHTAGQPSFQAEEMKNAMQNQ